MDVKVISRYVGFALLVSALFMFLSVLVSVFNGNDSALAALSISFVLTFTVGIFPFIFVKKVSVISMADGYMIIFLSWLLSFVFGMLPYALWGGPFTIVNAWFESVSGYTTTGASILEDVEALPRSLLFWRSSTHFIGGLGVVAFLLLVIPNTSQMRLRLTNMELSSLSKHDYKVRGNRTVYIFTSVYLGLFVLSFISYMIAGMTPFDALNHAMSVTATGGFSTKNASIAGFNSVGIDILTMVFMLLASVHFGILFVSVATRSLKPFKNEVFAFYVIGLAVGSLLVAASLTIHGTEPSFSQALLSASFQMVSYASTTGFAIADNSTWPVLASLMLLFIGIRCGMAGSTTGGIKSDRALILYKEIRYYLHSALHPSSIHEVRVNGRVIPQEDVAPHILYIAVFVSVMLVSIIMCLTFGVDNQNAFFGTISCLSNVGPSIGGSIGSMGNYGAEPAMAKLMYTLDMFLGRVEIYPILAVFLIVFGKKEHM